MDTKEEFWRKPKWMVCIDTDDLHGLSRELASPSFDFEQLTPPFVMISLVFDAEYKERYTPLGYAWRNRAYWAFEILLDAGASPDAECVSYEEDDYGEKTGTYRPRRPLECCLDSYTRDVFLEGFLKYCPTTLFDVQWPRAQFTEFLTGRQVLPFRAQVCFRMHARELRAYTAVWCASNAGGSWPDMVMLLQAVIMRDELCRETSKRQRK